MEKTQKLGQIGEMLQMAWEIYNKWAGASYFLDVRWAKMSYNRSSHLLIKTEQEKTSYTMKTEISLVNLIPDLEIENVEQ